MIEYEQVLAKVRRERETEERVRAMDAADIVQEIHTLEDRIAALEEELEEALEDIIYDG